MKKYTIHFSGKQTIYANSLIDAVESGKKYISYTPPNMNLVVGSVTLKDQGLEEE